MGLTVHFEVLNQLGTPMLYSSTLATRPNAGITGRIFYRTDYPWGIYRDNGVTWDLIGSNSSTSGGVFAVDKDYGGYDKSIAFWQSTPAGDYTFDINSDASFVYDYILGYVGIGTSTPGASLDIHGSDNSLLQLNNTTTGNSKLTFLNQNVQKWNIGNVYSGGSNYFQLYDIYGAKERISILNTGQFNQTGWIVNTNTVTGITGTVTTQTPNTSFTNNFTYNSGISTVASLNLVGIDVDNNVNYSGANTINQTSYNTAALLRTIMTFGSAAASITYTQATGIRTLANKQSIYIQDGTNSGTISHYANLQIFGDQKLNTGTTTFTNRYQVLLNDYDEFTAGFTYTNRWAIYQAGASNTNYFNGKIITGSSTTVGTYQLSVTGTTQLIGDIFQNTGNFTGSSVHNYSTNFSGGTNNDYIVFGINNITTNSTTAGAAYYGLYNTQFLDQSSLSNAGNNTIRGQYNNIAIRGLASGSILSAYGGVFNVSRTDASDISTSASNNLNGLQVSLNQTTGIGILTGNMRAFYNSSNITTGTVSNYYGVQLLNTIASFTTSLSTTITNYYGINIKETIGAASGGPGLISNYYGVYLNAPTVNATGTITNRWGLYAPDSVMNHSIVGSVAIGSGSITTSAQMSVVSTTKGFLPPVMTTTQKNAIATPAAGLIVFDTTLAKLCVYSGSAWQTITSV
jgi:hypothetical protein